MARIHESGFVPAQFLVENIEFLPRGRALDVAMGAGRNALYLARLGFEVEDVKIISAPLNISIRALSGNSLT